MNSLLPNSNSSSRRQTATFLLIVLLGSAIRFAIAWAPQEILLRFSLADDSFYYLTIAKHFAAGEGFSFDGIAQTNGFHPLWMVVIIPIYLLVEDTGTAIHLVLSLAAIIDICTLFVLYRLLVYLGVGSIASTPVVALHALSPLILSNSGPLNGLETSVNVLSIMLLLYSTARILTTEMEGPKPYFLLGVFSGIAFLARTDNAILLGILFFALFLFLRSHSISPRRLGLSALLATLVTAPWFLWSLWQFGTVLQVSGLSVAYATREVLAEEGWVTVNYVVQGIRNLAGLLVHFPVYLNDTRIFSFSTLPNLLFWLLVVLGLITMIRTRNHNPSVLSHLQLLAPFLIAFVFFVGVHTGRAVFLRGWYFASALPPLLVLTGVVLHFALHRNPFVKWSPPLQGLTIWIGLAVLLAASVPSLRPERIGEFDKFRMVRVLENAVPPDERIGSWNAGVFGYYLEGGIVVGLDGLVNNEIYPYIRNRSVGEYCKKTDIRYFVDAWGAIEYNRRFLGKGFYDSLSRSRILSSLHSHKEGEPILLLDSFDLSRDPEERDKDNEVNILK